MRAELQRVNGNGERPGCCCGRRIRPRKRAVRLLWSLPVIAVLAAAGFLAWRYLRPHASGVANIQSIAVLPFANASKRSRDGLPRRRSVQEITNSLSRVSDLQVMAHSTVSALQTRRQDDPQGVGARIARRCRADGAVAEHANDSTLGKRNWSNVDGGKLWGKNGTGATMKRRRAVCKGQSRPRFAKAATGYGFSGTERGKSLAKVGTHDPEAIKLYNSRPLTSLDEFATGDYRVNNPILPSGYWRDPNLTRQPTLALSLAYSLCRDSSAVISWKEIDAQGEGGGEEGFGIGRLRSPIPMSLIGLYRLGLRLRLEQCRQRIQARHRNWHHAAGLFFYNTDVSRTTVRT